MWYERWRGSFGLSALLFQLTNICMPTICENCSMVNRDESAKGLEGYTTQGVDFVKKKKTNKLNIKTKLLIFLQYTSQISWTPLATGIWINHVKKLSENTCVLAGITVWHRTATEEGPLYPVGWWHPLNGSNLHRQEGKHCLVSSKAWWDFNIPEAGMWRQRLPWKWRTHEIRRKRGGKNQQHVMRHWTVRFPGGAGGTQTQPKSNNKSF